MRRFLIYVLAFFSIAAGCCAESKPSDAELAVKLLGTWQDVEKGPPEKVISESTYTSDGVVAGWLLGNAKLADGSMKEVRVRVSAHWRLAGGVVFVSDYQTEPAGVLPKNYSQQYTVLSLNSEEVVFRAADDGSELHRRRKRANQQSLPTPV